MKTDDNIKLFISLRKQNIYSNDFERLTLASLIMFERNCEKYLIGPFCIYLNIDDFINPKHRLIFESIQELSNNGIKIDLVTLSKTLKKNKSLKDIGGVNFLVSIIDDFTSNQKK